MIFDSFILSIISGVNNSCYLIKYLLNIYILYKAFCFELFDGYIKYKFIYYINFKLILIIINELYIK